MEKAVQQNVDLSFLRPYLNSVEEDKKIYRYEIPAGTSIEFDLNIVSNYFGKETQQAWSRGPKGSRHIIDLQLLDGINYNLGL